MPTTARIIAQHFGHHTHGNLRRGLAAYVNANGAAQARMQRVAQNFAQQHQADQKLPDKDRAGYTLLPAMRSWEFEALRR